MTSHRWPVGRAADATKPIPDLGKPPRFPHKPPANSPPRRKPKPARGNS